MEYRMEKTKMEKAHQKETSDLIVELRQGISAIQARTRALRSASETEERKGETAARSEAQKRKLESDKALGWKKGEAEKTRQRMAKGEIEDEAAAALHGTAISMDTERAQKQKEEREKKQIEKHITGAAG